MTMSKKTDTTDTPTTTADDATEADEVKHHSPIKWVLGFIVLASAGIWAIDQGYLDRLLSADAPQEDESAYEAEYLPQSTEDTSAEIADEEPQFATQETTLATPVEPAAENGAESAELEAMLQSQAAAKREQAQIRREMEAIKRTVSSLNKNIKDLTESIEKKQQEPTTIAVSTTNTDSLVRLENRISELTSRLDALQQSYDQQSMQYGKRLEMTRKLDDVADKVAQGAAFRDDMPELQKLALELDMGGEAITNLQSQASDGVPTLAELMQTFDEVTKLAIPFTLDSQQNTSTADRLRSRIAHVVSIRKTDVSAEDNSDEAHIARAERELQAGNVDMAMTHIQQLPEETQQFYFAWQQSASAYLDAQNAINKLRAALLRDSGGE